MTESPWSPQQIWDMNDLPREAFEMMAKGGHWRLQSPPDISPEKPFSLEHTVCWLYVFYAKPDYNSDFDHPRWQVWGYLEGRQADPIMVGYIEK